MRREVRKGMLQQHVDKASPMPHSTQIIMRIITTYWPCWGSNRQANMICFFELTLSFYIGYIFNWQFSTDADDHLTTSFVSSYEYNWNTAYNHCLRPHRLEMVNGLSSATLLKVPKPKILPFVPKGYPPTPPSKNHFPCRIYAYKLHYW